MRKTFNSRNQAIKETSGEEKKPRPIWNAIENNIGVGLIVSLPVVFMLASMSAPDATAPQNDKIPSWVDDFDVRADNKTCTITNRKTKQSFVSKDGARVEIGDGFSVSSSPSSCNVTAPDKETCQLRGWPIKPIC